MDNNSLEQFYSGIPHPGYLRYPISPQNPHYLLDPNIGMYMQQFPGESGHFNSHMYHYVQQQQYQQVQMDRFPQPPQVSQSPHVPFVYQIPRVLYEPLPRVSPCLHSSPRFQTHANKSNILQQQLQQEGLEDTNFQNSLVHPEQADQKGASSVFNLKEQHHNSHHIPHSSSIVNQNNQGVVVKNEEEDGQSLKEIHVTVGNRDSLENNLGEDLLSKIKMEDEKSFSNSQCKQSDITKSGQNNQRNDLINQLQRDIKLEESTIMNPCKQEPQEKERDQLYQDEENGNKQNLNAISKNTYLQNWSKQVEDIQIKLENTDDNLKISQQINESKRIIKTRNNCIKKQVVNKKDNTNTSRIKKYCNTPLYQTNSVRTLNVVREENNLIQDQTVEREENIEQMQLFYDGLSEENSKIIQRLMKIKIQNCFKNSIKGFMKTVNKKFKKIYIYQNPNNEALVGNNLKTLDIMTVEDPSPKEKAVFSQKFNKFFNQKRFNTRSIGQITKSTLYSKILIEFLDNYSEEWLQQSELSNKEDNEVFLRFLQLAIKDNRYLFFLQRANVNQLQNIL